MTLRYMTSRNVDLFLLLLAMIWGSTYPIMKIGLAELSPLNFLAVRFLIASAILIVIFFNYFRQLTQGEVLWGVLLGFLIGSGNILQGIGLKITSSGKAGFITGLYIVLVPFFSYLFLKLQLSLSHFVGVGLSLIGLVLLTVKQSFVIEVGDLWVFLSAIAYAFHIVVISHAGARHNPIRLSVIQLFIAGLMSLFLSFAIESGIGPIKRSAFFPLFYTSVIGTALLYVIHTWIQPRTNPIRAGLLLGSEALFAAFFGWLFLAETMTQLELLGGLLMATGIYCSEWRKK